VVVNNRAVTDAKGKTTQVALSGEEIEKLTALVRESIGFKQDRGDSVKVINAPFKIETVTALDVPWWKQPDMLDLLRAAAMPLGLAIVAILVFFGLVRPALKAIPAMPRVVPGAQVNTVVDEPPPLPVLPPPKPNEHLDHAKAMAKQNPAAVAGILRGWVGSDVNATPVR
jgi:flagellar M-ring protein FliF